MISQKHAFILLFYAMFFMTPLVIVMLFDIHLNDDPEMAIVEWYAVLFVMRGVYAAFDNLITVAFEWYAEQLGGYNS